MPLIVSPDGELGDCGTCDVAMLYLDARDRANRLEFACRRMVRYAKEVELGHIAPEALLSGDVLFWAVKPARDVCEEIDRANSIVGD